MIPNVTECTEWNGPVHIHGLVSEFVSNQATKHDYPELDARKPLTKAQQRELEKLSREHAQREFDDKKSLEQKGAQAPEQRRNVLAPSGRQPTRTVPLSSPQVLSSVLKA